MIQLDDADDDMDEDYTVTFEVKLVDVLKHLAQWPQLGTWRAEVSLSRFLPEYQSTDRDSQNFYYISLNFSSQFHLCFVGYTSNSLQMSVPVALQIIKNK